MNSSAVGDHRQNSNLGTVFGDVLKYEKNLGSDFAPGIATEMVVLPANLSRGRPPTCDLFP